MATLETIRAALKTTLKTYLAGPVNVYDYVSDTIETPAIIVSLNPGSGNRPTGKYDGAFARGMDEWYFELLVFVTRREGGYPQKELDKYLTGSGTKSIREVLFKHADLGLTDGTDASAESVSNYGGEYTYMKVPHVGASVNVCVRTNGSS